MKTLYGSGDGGRKRAGPGSREVRNNCLLRRWILAGESHGTPKLGMNDARIILPQAGHVNPGRNESMVASRLKLMEPQTIGYAVCISASICP